MISSVLRRADPSEALVETVLSKAEGNPFFLEELTRSLLEHPDVLVPDTIQGVLMARIDRLPEEHKRLLQTASVLGREFALHLLTRVWETGGRPDAAARGPQAVGVLLRGADGRGAALPLQARPHPGGGLPDPAEGAAAEPARGGGPGLRAAPRRPPGGRLRHAWPITIPRPTTRAKAVSYLSLFAGQAAGRYAHSEAAQALREALAHCDRLPGPASATAAVWS